MAKNDKTRFFYVLYSDRTWVFDQSECTQGPIYIILIYKGDSNIIGKYILIILKLAWHTAFYSINVPLPLNKV